jgi:hypothetical protein
MHANLSVMEFWITVIGLPLTIVGLVLNIYFGRKTDKKRVPTFVLSPSRDTLAKPILNKLSGFSVTHQGKPIGENGITALFAFFWNSGSLPILANEVLRPYQIRLSVGRVLEAKITRASRAEVGFALAQISDSALEISFDALEPGDGATMQIICDGDPGLDLSFDGACIGAARPTVLPPDEIYFKTMASRFKETNTVILGSGVLVVCGIVPFFGLMWLLNRFLGPRWPAAVFVLMLIALICLTAIIATRSIYRRVSAKLVPPGIRSDATPKGQG